ncbi:MAG: tyrosine--tRNA ligase [Actinomycetaceae bacterium]|nr:tyrosine--tRNA ligase [Actinomycetaceae bacterium]MDY6083255.1 tyrosine--tRNA ligase [Actinomycetaceae bacterium]
MADVVDELQWRGLIAHHTDMDALRAALNRGNLTFYCGFDPTAPSLHHGHLVAIKVMRHLQMAGHNPIAVVGGATGLIGDPRDKGERVLNQKDVVAQWADDLKGQLEGLLDFDGEHAARIVNNLDWTAELSAIDFLRDIGKNFRVGTMLSKDIVARRLNSDEGISFTEFSYQILQANDFLQLYRRYGCTMEIGGDDQWGNLVGGIDLIHKREGASVHVMTNPLITKSDGTKFGKSEGGAIWLNPTMFSPYKFYQFWLNQADADVIHLLKVFTFRSREEIQALEEERDANPGARTAQRVLASDVTTWVHGSATTERVEQASRALFGREDLNEIDSQTLRDAAEELPYTDAHVGEPLVDIVARVGLEKSRAAARRTATSGGIYVNNRKVVDTDRVLTSEDILDSGLVFLRKGKKNLAVVRLDHTA